MYKTVIKNPQNNVSFIIYNHLASQDKSYQFTTKQLQSELQQYDLNLSLDEIQREINSLIKAGLIEQHFRYYKYI
jgi:hypothetical protein